MCHMGEGCRAFEKVERLTLQQAGTHPAPCARTCEANAYEIEIRRVSAERDEATKRSRIAEKNLIDAQEAGKKLAKQAFDAERERDALVRDAERYRWIRGGSRIGVKWCELYSGGVALDEAIDSTMKALPSITAKARFDKAGGHEEPDPIERLRFFCSKAMSGQDWFDVEQFFDEVIAERDALAAKLAELEGQEPVAWLYDWKAPEGLIQDWSTNNATEIPEHATHIRPLFARPIPADQPVSARLLDVATGKIPHLYAGLCPDIDASSSSRDPECPACQALIAAEAQQERSLQDMHDAGREIDRVMADPVRLTDAEIMQSIRHISFNKMTAFNIGRAIEAAVLTKNMGQIGWQPIETAPPNEILLLACEFDGPGDWRIKCGYYDKENNRGWKVWGSSWTPTRWMQMPPNPESSGAPHDHP